MIAVFRPSWAERIAATYPPGPAPRTTTSKCALMSDTLGAELVRQELNGATPRVGPRGGRGGRRAARGEPHAGARNDHVRGRPVRRARDQVSCLGVHDVLVPVRVPVFRQPAEGDLAQLLARPRLVLTG